ncbi:MAG: GTPase HflX [Proteobacteria bacterium]|nr:MAG: GTPase HflX [Pseudomonadota bacterium]
MPQGKLEAAKALALHKGADAIIVDLELSPNQLRNMEEFVELPTLDRPGVILEIFYQHARSKEAKTQVELARLQYILPRLAHLWNHFERQRGGGVGNRGMGETQIEVDRRLVKRRMQMLEKRLKEIESERITQRAGRKEVLKVALVGYTNAGKSTLLNALTHSKVLAEDKLFATLDPSIRMLSPDSHPPVVAVDTVGFVSRLPHGLVASFRSTLEEVAEADLLVHVVDGSSETASEELKVTEEVLADLGVADRPKMVVVNKVDLIEKGPDGLLRKNQLRVIAPGALLLSALDLEEVKKLRTRIMDHFKERLTTYEVLIPYAESRMEALIHEHGSVDLKRHHEKGTFIKVRMDEAWARKLGLEKFST